MIRKPTFERWGMQKCGGKWVEMFTHPYDCKKKHPKLKKMSGKEMRDFREILEAIAAIC